MEKVSDFKGLAHICVYTKDIGESIKFYLEALDFEVSYDTVVYPEINNGFFPLKYVLVQRESCIIELLQPADTSNIKLGEEGIISHFAMEVQNIEQAFFDLKAKGYFHESDSITEMPGLFNGAKTCFIKGPSGESIELFEYL